MATFNFNVGVLGHVDSGKTSLSKALSTVESTASFDKNPQSRERGITLDLGFSSFSVDIPEHLREAAPQCPSLQYTLVDCPGHASLIRTIIGGNAGSSHRGFLVEKKYEPSIVCRIVSFPWKQAPVVQYIESFMYCLLSLLYT